jgi:HD-GYP domain-containing protein (c-di-GMP phosphodiesterase class II)
MNLRKRSTWPDWFTTDITDLEMSIIKTHPQIGYDILKNIDFPWPIAQMALQHHERMNGSGYPKGLKGKDIMMEARILGVADVVEAICYPRSYRSALTIEQAIEELIKNKETLYDSAVVDVCVSLFRKTGFSFIHSLELCETLREANI